MFFCERPPTGLHIAETGRVFVLLFVDLGVFRPIFAGLSKICLIRAGVMVS